MGTALLSPRLAGTFRLDAEDTPQLSAGIGIIYDATNLGLIHQPLEGQRVDYFFDSNGCARSRRTARVLFANSRRQRGNPRRFRFQPPLWSIEIRWKRRVT